MVIEWLKFDVDPELREAFIQADDDIWSTALANYPGYLGKEVWISPTAPRDVIVIVRWASQAAWDAVPTDEVNQVEARFSARMKGAYRLVESSAYQQRKFRQNS
ncbi:MAG: TIGR03792 family protein [Cyanobacteria bacterium]|nr:TIGR03792 family protein [Cyanobacteriota bacterium]MDW8201917.1 TIGR03792 family protein [Cyanobacteriota bacterium SKYGB_h_bin112]